MKFSYATHGIISPLSLAFVRRKKKLVPKHTILAFSLDGYYTLYQKELTQIVLIYPLEYILQITKPVLYFYPFHLRQSFPSFDAYYAQLFWETEVFTTQEVPLEKAQYQVLYRARKPLPSIPTLPYLPERTLHIENQASYLLTSKKDISLAYITNDENLLSILDTIEQYNKTLCNLYNIDYDESKKQAKASLSPLHLKTLQKLKWSFLD